MGRWLFVVVMVASVVGRSDGRCFCSVIARFGGHLEPGSWLVELRGSIPGGVYAESSE